MAREETVEKACQECVTAHEKHAAPSTLEQTGPVVGQEFGGGAAYETSTPYRCRVCHTEWEHVVESGYGSDGPFWHMQNG